MAIYFNKLDAKSKAVINAALQKHNININASEMAKVKKKQDNESNFILFLLTANKKYI